jgi:hypothetical protein
MSEINSIAQGTYTLGQTSATTYQAGPGISITQPSEGTVRISNDETVLWEGTLTASTDKITLSEAKTNFDRIGIYFKCYERTYFVQITGDSDFQIGVVFVFQDGYLQACGTRWNTSDQIEFSWKSTITAYWGQSLSNGWSSNIVPIKIIGINRISGGNA